MEYSMRENEAREIFDTLIEISQKDEDALELWQEILEISEVYAGLRFKWETASLDERLQMDELRSLRHDVLIIKFNQYKRYCQMKGYDVSWREQLGDEKRDPENRKRIGDMACWICLFLELKAR